MGGRSWPILVCGYSFVTMAAHYRLAIGLLLPVREPERPYRLRRGVIPAPPHRSRLVLFRLVANRIRIPHPADPRWMIKGEFRTIRDFNATYANPYPLNRGTMMTRWSFPPWKLISFLFFPRWRASFLTSIFSSLDRSVPSNLARRNF